MERTSAEHVAVQLIQSGQISEVADVHANIYAEARTEDGGANEIRRQPLPLISAELRGVLAEATPSGPVNDADYPVAVLNDVLEQAQETAWRRREEERGIWLLGNLILQPKPKPEIVGVIHTAVEAQSAKHELFRIDLTTATFTDVNVQIERRRRRLGREGELNMGFYHTHPFLPSVIDGREACPSCPLQPECNLTSSFFSTRDAEFHVAVFGRTAYAIELVLGLTPREKFDLKMFCFDGGKFRERGFYCLDSLPPELKGSLP